MPRAVLTWYVRLVVGAGAAVLLYSLAALADTPRPLEWLLFATLAVLAGSFTLRIAAVEATLSVADTFLIAATLLYGPAPATVALAVDTCLISWRKGHSWNRVAFNTAAPALSLWVAGQAFFAMSGVAPLAIDRGAPGPLLGPLVCLAAIYFLLNSGMMAVAVGLDARQSPLQLWRRHFVWLSLGYFAAASVALGLTLVIQQVGLVALAIILPVIALFHWTFRASFGRLEDANRHLSQMDRLYMSTVETLAMAIDAKDDVTHSHVRRVQAYATALARALGVSDEPTLKALEAAALLHDTGKLAVPEHILNKPGGLTPAEFEQMKRHVDIGADILALVDFPYPVVPIVRCHHESWDGTGYPRGVAGADIPIGARILSVVDCYDALTSDRPYRRRLSEEAALQILIDRRGSMYDPLVVDTFIQIYRDVRVTDSPTDARRQVLDQISPARREEPGAGIEGSMVTAASDPPMAADAAAFVSLGRLASGLVSVDDVLTLAAPLVQGIVPGASGAWYLLDGTGERLRAVDAFGPAAPLLAGNVMPVGDRLTGWVAAHRQTIANSDPALDLDDRAARAIPALISSLSTPLADGHQLVGALTCYASAADAFSDGQRQRIERVAPLIARALQAAGRAPAAAPEQTGRDLRLVASR
jgi:putative nucleotidyltransferase with HDIG domain